MTAPYDRWVLLGKLLDERRRVLGYTYRVPGFEREHGVNRRMAADLEKAAPARVDHFTEGSLRLAARGYQVTYASMMAVLAGTADELTPAGPAVPAEPPGWMPPMTDAARIASARPYADRIHARLRHLSGQGVTDPDGAQVFGPGPDARTWDGTAGRWDLDERVWMIADMQRRDGGRPGRSETG